MEEVTGPYYTSVMYLTIKNIHKSDLGGYKCVSKNSIGDAEGTIRLYGKLFYFIIPLRGISINIC